MLNLLQPDSGAISIGGLDSRKQDVEIKRFTTYVPADPYFFNNWTAKEHLDLVEHFRGPAPWRTELTSAFEFDPHVPIHNLSTGNKQKLSLILAMMHQPAVLILDEPTRGLDPLLQNKFYDYLRALRDAGSAIFMSSHNLAEVEMVCGRVGIIRSGKIVEVSEIKALQDKRMHLVSVTFMDKEHPTAADLLEIDPDIEILEAYENYFELRISGDLNLLLKLLAKYRVVDLNVKRASLEDIFMEFYK
jgi:ABC-2 type transport system ATP-binding protein